MKFCQHWKNKIKWGWAKTRAIVSRPLIWNPIVWSPYGNETKWHPRFVFSPLSRSILIIFLIGNIFEPKQILTPVVSCRNIWPLKYVPTARNEWNSYGLSAIKRRRSFETKKKLWNAPRRDQLFGVVLPNTPCDQEIRVPGRWKNNVHLLLAARTIWYPFLM